MAKHQPIIRAFDQMVRNQFSEAMEIGFAQHKIDPLPPGHISIEEKDRGGKYGKWRRLGGDGKPATPLYIGALDSEQYQDAVAQLEELERIERTAKNLRKLGLATEDNASAIVIATLANAGYFSGGGVLVGTRAFRSLANQLGYSVPSTSTKDVDLARQHAIKLAIQISNGGMLELLKQTGMKFVEVPGFKKNEKSSSWQVVGKEIKIDLLVPAKDESHAYQIEAVPELGAHATTLEFLDYLIEDPIDGIVIGKSQLIPVKVPTPSRFFWHKLATSQMRPHVFKSKSEKDILQAVCIALCMEEGGYKEITDSSKYIPKKMKEKIMMAKDSAISIAKIKREYIELLFSNLSD